MAGGVYLPISMYTVHTIDILTAFVVGRVPRWLSGRLTRNGPGRMHYGSSSYKHLFDGSAYIQQFIMDRGHVQYQSRLVTVLIVIILNWLESEIHE